MAYCSKKLRIFAVIVNTKEELMKTRNVSYLAIVAFVCLSAFGFQLPNQGEARASVQLCQQKCAKKVGAKTKKKTKKQIVQKQSGEEKTAVKQLEIPGALTNRPEQILSRVAYTASYNSALRIPNWVAWHLTAERCEGSYDRKGIRFQEDGDVPKPRAVDKDYVKSGYDRGHLCPSADNRWDATAQKQSFLLTNICPQDHNLNTGDWSELESQCRKWAQTYGSIYIVAGPVLLKDEHKTIGKNKITVPEAFFKVVLCMEGKPKAIGFVYLNERGNHPKAYYVNTIDAVERITGIDFFPALPDEVENVVEANCDLEEW